MARAREQAGEDGDEMAVMKVLHHLVTKRWKRRVAGTKAKLAEQRRKHLHQQGVDIPAHVIEARRKEANRMSDLAERLGGAARCKPPGAMGEVSGEILSGMMLEGKLGRLAPPFSEAVWNTEELIERRWALMRYVSCTVWIVRRLTFYWQIVGGA